MKVYEIIFNSISADRVRISEKQFDYLTKSKMSGLVKLLDDDGEPTMAVNVDNISEIRLVGYSK